jgi:hypothetical protein
MILGSTVAVSHLLLSFSGHSADSNSDTARALLSCHSPQERAPTSCDPPPSPDTAPSPPLPPACFCRGRAPPAHRAARPPWRLVPARRRPRRAGPRPRRLRARPSGVRWSGGHAARTSPAADRPSRPAPSPPPLPPARHPPSPSPPSPPLRRRRRRTRTPPAAGAARCGTRRGCRARRLSGASRSASAACALPAQRGPQRAGRHFCRGGRGATGRSWPAGRWLAARFDHPAGSLRCARSSRPGPTHAAHARLRQQSAPPAHGRPRTWPAGRPEPWTTGRPVMTAA